jgi:hypothetical protein
MKIKIYQIDSNRDNKRVMYGNHERTLEHAGKIDPSIYNTVFDGEVDCDNLEGVYTLFNSDIPLTHQGHSLSVSDIVEVLKADEQSSPSSTQPGCYFCDSVGFVRLEDGFDSTQTQPMRGDRMLVVEPHKPPYEAVISDDYKAWQRAVGGTFECTYPFDDDTFVISNDEAKLIGLEGNRTINGDIYAGVFLIARDDGEGGTKNLTDKQVAKYSKQFEADETYTQEEVEGSAGMFFISFN